MRNYEVENEEQASIATSQFKLLLWQTALIGSPFDTYPPVKLYLERVKRVRFILWKGHNY